jgi:hypothetical protein
VSDACADERLANVIYTISHNTTLDCFKFDSSEPAEDASNERSSTGCTGNTQAAKALTFWGLYASIICLWALTISSHTCCWRVPSTNWRSELIDSVGSPCAGRQSATSRRASLRVMAK